MKHFLPENPLQGSLAEYFCLKKHLAELEESSLQDIDFDNVNLNVLPKTIKVIENNKLVVYRTINYLRIKHSRETLTKVLDKQGKLTCVYCGNTNLKIQLDNRIINSKKKASLDHIIPVSKNGGVFDKTNIVCSCQRCNSRKRNLDVKTFLWKLKMEYTEFETRRKIFQSLI